MAVKKLDVGRSCSKLGLLRDIREADGRKLVLEKARIQAVPGRKTVLKLRDNCGDLGLLRAKTQTEANRILEAKTVTLSIGWDRNRNERVMVNFAS